MNKKIVSAFLAMVLFFTAAGFDSLVTQAATEQSSLPTLNAQSPTDIGTLAVAGQCDYAMSGFNYHSTFYYNEKVEKAVILTGAIILSHKIPWVWGKIGVQVANSYNLLFNSNVYITQHYYRMFAQTRRSPLPVAAEKAVTRYYADSAKTKLLDTKVHYKYSSWYCK